MEHAENNRIEVGIKDALPSVVGATLGFAAYHLITAGQLNELSREEVPKSDTHLDTQDDLIASQKQFLNAFNLDAAGVSTNSEAYLTELRSEQPHSIGSPEVFGIGGAMLGLALTVAAIIGAKRREASGR